MSKITDLVKEAKLIYCEKGWVTNENRKHLLIDVFGTCKNLGIEKDEVKLSERSVCQLLIGDIKKCPKDKRDYIINKTSSDFLEALCEIYGTELKTGHETIEIKKRVPVKKEVVESYEIDWNNVLNDEYARKNGIELGAPMEERLDTDFCKKLGIL